MKKQNNFLPPMSDMRAQAPPALAPGILPGIKPQDLKAVTCKKCEKVQDKFIAIALLRHASPLQTVHSQPMIVNFNNGFACLKCGAINEFTIEGVVDPTETAPKAKKDLS